MHSFDVMHRHMNSKLWKDAEVVDVFTEVKQQSNWPTANKFFVIVVLEITLEAKGLAVSMLFAPGIKGANRCALQIKRRLFRRSTSLNR